MGIMSLIRWLFGADAAAPSDAMKLPFNWSAADSPQLRKIASASLLGRW
jgi:hypothetical protein